MKIGLLGVDILDGLPNVVYGNDGENGTEDFASCDESGYKGENKNVDGCTPGGGNRLP